MKIEMKRAPKPRDPRHDITDESVKMPIVWWWQVLEEEGGERVPNGAGWEIGRDQAYDTALKRMRAEKAQRRANA